MKRDATAWNIYVVCRREEDKERLLAATKTLRSLETATPPKRPDNSGQETTPSPPSA